MAVAPCHRPWRGYIGAWNLAPNASMQDELISVFTVHQEATGGLE
ncbi:MULTISPECIES: hypothetical protein [unclassified Streptomyces]|nr:hypothetical protein [Streptomyces sp. TSRI0281]